MSIQPPSLSLLPSLLQARTIYVNLSNKGGAGKSLLSDMLLDCLRRAGIPTVGIDLDFTNKSLSMIHGKHLDNVYDFDANLAAAVEAMPSGCLRYNAASEKEFAAMLDLLASPDFQFSAAVIDLPGGDQDDMNALTGDLRDVTAALTDLGFRVVINPVVDHDQASAAGIAPTLCAWGAGTHLRVIKNVKTDQQVGQPFSWYEGALGGGVKPVDVVRFAGGVEMTMPFLHGAEEFRKLSSVKHTPLSKLTLSFAENIKRKKIQSVFDAALVASEIELASRGAITAEQIEAIEAAQSTGEPLALAAV